MSGGESALPGPTRVVRTEDTWIEDDAVRQLRAVARRPGMRLAVGMPNLHPGQGGPVGAAFVSSVIYPDLLGNDVGCGMGLWQTDLARAGFQADLAAERLVGLDGPAASEAEAWMAGGTRPPEHEAVSGTIGGGDHFAELLAVEEVVSVAAARQLGVHPDRLLLLVHSGSRGRGTAMLATHLANHGTAGLEPDSPDGEVYLHRHGATVAWAGSNRRLIVQRFGAVLRFDAVGLLDVAHNSVEPVPGTIERVWLHRRGAAPADRGPIVLSGSRGSPSLIVAPIGEQTATARTLAYGAGRRWSRAWAQDRLEGRVRVEDLIRPAGGGVVICEDQTRLYEEAPEAYKDVEAVVGDLVAWGLVEVVAVLRPVLTYKTRRVADLERDAYGLPLPEGRERHR